MYPESGKIFTSFRNKDLDEEFELNYRYASEFWSGYSAFANITSRTVAGRTWSRREVEELNLEGREALEFNIVRKPIQFYSGYLRDNLNSVVISPVEGSDQNTADHLTKVSTYVWDKGRGFPMFLDAADEAFKIGMSLVGIYADYSNDPINGDINFFKRTYNSFFIDPTCERIDLKDCSFVIMRDLLDKNIVKSMLPFIDPKEIDHLQNSYKDDKFINYSPNFTSLSRTQNIMAYDQYYKRKQVKKTVLIDNSSGIYRDITDLNRSEKGDIKTVLRRMESIQGIEGEEFSNLSVKQIWKDEIELNIMINGKSVYTGKDKTGIVDRFPFVPCFCYFEPSLWDSQDRVQGLSQSLYSATREFNKRHMKIIDIMDSCVTTGFKYLLGSVPDPKDMQQTGQNRIIGISEDAPQGLGSVEELRGGSVPPELFQYQQILDDMTLSLTNINESLLGIDSGGNTQISGKLAETRAFQGLRTSRKVFDNIAESQKVLGEVVLEGIQKMYPPEKVERILGEKPAEQFYNKNFERYDAILKEGIRSKSQRDSYYYELINLKKEGIIPDIPTSEILKYLPLSGGQSDLKEILESQEEARKAQENENQEQQRSTVELINALKEQNIALAQEKRAKVIEDIASTREKISQSGLNKAKAGLERAKTITEIESIKTENLMKAITLLQQLKSSEDSQEEIDVENTESAANALNEDTQGSIEQRTKETEQELKNVIEEGFDNSNQEKQITLEKDNER